MRSGSRTRLTLDKLEYNVPLKDENFTLQALPPPVTIGRGLCALTAVVALHAAAVAAQPISLPWLH